MALFCATSVANLMVLLLKSAEEKTVNVVYPKILQYMRQNAGNVRINNDANIKIT